MVEYGHLRAEVLATVAEPPANERWAMLAIATFWAWFAATGHESALALFVVWVPTALAVLFCLRAYAIFKKLKTMHFYLLKVETELELEGFGWETKLDESGWFPISVNRHWFWIHNLLFWSSLLVGNSILAIIFTNAGFF